MKNTTHESIENPLKKTSNKEFALIETILLEDGTLFLLDLHLKRLSNSAGFFSISFNLLELKQELTLLQKAYPKGKHRVRILLKKNGFYSIKVDSLTPIEEVKVVALAKQAIQTNSFSFHKTTLRSHLDRALKAHPHVFDVILYNEFGELTEFTIGNLVLKLDGALYTPHQSSGLLPGTFRQHLLLNNELKEAKLMIKDLEQAQAIYLINSLRKWVEVRLI